LASRESVYARLKPMRYENYVIPEGAVCLGDFWINSSLTLGGLPPSNRLNENKLYPIFQSNFISRYYELIKVFITKWKQVPRPIKFALPFQFRVTPRMTPEQLGLVLILSFHGIQILQSLTKNASQKICFQIDIGSIMNAIDILRVDKNVFSVTSLLGASDEKTYWLAKTPYERLAAMELMRQINYGYDATTARLQRVLEVARLTSS